jgi:hypothetical protein
MYVSLRHGARSKASQPASVFLGCGDDTVDSRAPKFACFSGRNAGLKLRFAGEFECDYRCYQ